MTALVPVRQPPARGTPQVHTPLFPDVVRANGIRISGAPGTGKSFLLGRGVVFDDFIRGFGQVVFDGTGSTVDNFADHVSYIVPDFERRFWLHYRQPLPAAWVRYLEDVQALFAQRVVYVDMSGLEAVMPFPLLYRLSPDDSLYAIAQRPLEVFARLDVDLARAPVEGLNSLMKLGTNVNMILAALGYQLTEAPDLIYHPERWGGRFEQALSAYPEEVAPAIAAIREFGKNKLEYRVRRSDALLTKIDMFLKDPALRAMVGAARPGIEWHQVIANKQTVLLDFRKIQSTEKMRFLMLWAFLYLTTFLKWRGPAGRRQPFGIVFDELSVLLGFKSAEQSLMAEDIRQLVEVIGRNYGCWVTLAHQNLGQILDTSVVNALMQMGTQCIGTVTNPDEAEYLARHFYPYDPHKIKKTENVWMKIDPIPIMTYFGSSEFAQPQVIDTRKIEYTVEEQRILSSYNFTRLRRLQFLTKMPHAEGDLSGTVKLLDFHALDTKRYLTDEQLGELRRRLAKRSGFAQDDLLAEIDKRSHKHTPKKQVKASSEPVKLTTHTDDIHTPAIATDQSSSRGTHGAATPLAPAGSSHPGSRDNDFWERRTK